MTLPVIDPNTGALPPGRFRATVDELAEAFATNDHRRALLTEWLHATDLLRDATPVCVAWIGGSFLTSKDLPGDIDSLYMIDAQHVPPPDSDAGQVLTAFSTPGFLTDKMQLRVDSFLLLWHSNATPANDHPDIRSYYVRRGYWDDLWSKQRSGPKGATPQRLDSHPRRGYVEVILDGFHTSGPFLAP